MTVARTHIPTRAAESAFPSYSREEILVDAALHALGIGGALVGVPVMVALAVVWYHDATTIGAALIYGLGLIAMFACSASYNFVQTPRLKAWLQRLDHAAIYIKIAGTYTPLAVLLAGAEAPGILAGVWGAALGGAALKLFSVRRWEWAALALYFALGWAVLVIGKPILAGASSATFALMIAGGLVYSLGVVFLYWPRLRFHNAIWHAHVLAASYIFYAAILVEVARHAPGF